MNSVVERAPARFSTVATFGAAFVATATTALTSIVAFLVGLGGVAGIFIALHRQSRRGLAYGVGGVLLGTLLAGLDGGSALTVLVSLTAGVLCWDFGTTAISVGRQLGRNADTERLERVHAAASLGVGTLTVLVSYGIYRSISGTHPVAAVFFLLLTAILLTIALR